MNRSLTTNGPLAPAAVLLSIVMLIVALAGPGLFPASADQFTPLEDPPSITIVADEIYTGANAGLDPSDSAFTALGGAAIQPASPTASPRTVHNIFAKLETNGDLGNVTEIRLCLYDAADDAFLDGSDPDESAIEEQCGIPETLSAGSGLPDAPTAEDQAWHGDGPDPTRVFVMRWLASAYNTDEGSEDNGFQVVGANNYADANSLFTPSGQEATARFSFNVSNAMQVSSDWQVRIAAESQATIDSAPQTKQSAQDTAGPFTVGYFAQMTTPRTATSFGIVAPGVTVFRTKSVSVGDSSTEIETGAFTANDATALTIQATKFTRVTGNGSDDEILLDASGDIWNGNQDRSDGDSLAQMLAAMTNVEEDRVSLDCAFLDEVSFDGDDRPDEADELKQFVQVRTSARVFALPGTSLGEPRQTGELAETLDAHSCMLNYEGGAPTANVEYSNTVTVAPIQKSGSPELGDD